ncbi:TPA: hypothetical protein TZS69_001927 [Streptococcus suis]|nr:hypothetical protein [Streptococcus suis]
MQEMSVSFKKAARKTNLKHNNRDLSEEEWNQKQHKHIVRDLSDQNIIVIQKDIREVYHEQFNEPLAEYNSGKRKDRQIKDYYDHIKKSKSHEEQYEIIAGLGSKKDWEKLPFDVKKQAGELLADYAREFIERNENLIVYNAVVHLDEEGAPHLHLNFVPVATGYKKGLTKQVSLSKALENEGYPGRGKDSREQWNLFRKTEVASLTRFLKELGYERKLVGSNNIKDMREFKETMAEITQEIARSKDEKQKELKQLDNDISDKKADMKMLTNRVTELDDLSQKMLSKAKEQNLVIKNQKQIITDLQEKIELQDNMLHDLNLLDRGKQFFSKNEDKRAYELARKLTQKRTAELSERVEKAENEAWQANSKLQSHSKAYSNINKENRRLMRENEDLKQANENLIRENDILSFSLEILQMAFDKVEDFLKSIRQWNPFKKIFKAESPDVFDEFEKIRYPEMKNEPIKDIYEHIRDELSL